VAQLVETLRYKPEVRGSDSRWCHLNSWTTQSFPPHGVPGIDSSSLRNEYQWYVGLTILLSLCADCLEILGASTFWSPNGTSRPV
jgi:hypothetical protein